MRRVMVTWIEHTRETKVFEVDDDDPVIITGLEDSVADLIENGEGYSKSYAVEERHILDVEVVE